MIYYLTTRLLDYLNTYLRHTPYYTFYPNTMSAPKNVLFFLFLTVCSLPLTAQICTGNLGDNIFEAGDFGSGTDNVVQIDPMIAPGFRYQTIPPPNDGFYTITNDMRQWAGTFPTWDAFPDNSDDPNGYMMIVNAAFEPGKFYEQTVDGLCENTEYQFTADVRNILRPGNNQILPNVSFLINDVIQFTTGNVPENQQWNTYGFSFNTGPGETTVTLALSNNAPGGFGNDLAIDNIEFRACGPEARIGGEETLSICEDGDPAPLLTVINGDQYDDPAFQWQQSFDEGMTWQNIVGENGETFLHTNLSSGFYYYRYLLANGSVNLANNKCRVVSNTKIVYVVPKRYEIIDTLCAGLSFAVGNNAYNQTGTTIDTLVSSLGCDSIVTLRLTILPDPGLVANFNVVDPSCSDFENGSIQLTSVTGAVDPLELMLFDTLQNPANLFPTLPEGDYPYAITDRYGCATQGTLSLRSPNPFEVNLGGDITIELGDIARINTTAFDTISAYNWLPAGISDCTQDCAVLEIAPQNTFQLTLNATSDAGCPASDSIQITVVKNRKVYFATAFSPNDDGINDNFTLQGAVPNVTVIESLEVFDRWGNQVFAGTDLLPNDLSVGWNGRDLNGRDAPAGTYVYTGRIRFLDGETREYSGSLVLVR